MFQGMCKQRIFLGTTGTIRKAAICIEDGGETDSYSKQCCSHILPWGGIRFWCEVWNVNQVWVTTMIGFLHEKEELFSQVVSYVASIWHRQSFMSKQATWTTLFNILACFGNCYMEKLPVLSKSYTEHCGCWWSAGCLSLFVHWFKWKIHFI